MAKHRVSELEGALLDAAVAKAEGRPFFMDASVDEEYGTRTDWCMAARVPTAENPSRRRSDHKEFTPSGDWADAGPIIEREGIAVRLEPKPDLYDEWGDRPPWPRTWIADGRHRMTGATALVAAMRAYVASKFGEEVEL